MDSANQRGTAARLRAFEATVGSTSHAVFCCALTKLMPLVTGEHDLYAPFYKLSELRLPRGGIPNWEVLRAVAETALFGEKFKTSIHYAALTLNGRGLSSYGECCIQLRESLIAHRSSVFEENSILFMKHHDIKMFESDQLPKGYRTDWNGRGKLAAVKLAEQVEANTPDNAFATILMRPATSRVDDDFVEVHLFGPLTAYAFEKVSVTRAKSASGTGKTRKRSRSQRGNTNLKLLAEKISSVGGDIESLA